MDGAEIREAAHGVALLLIDLINDLEFDGAGPMRDAMPALAEVALGLRDEAERLGVPVIYVNDNHGQWHSDRERIVEAILNGRTAGRELAQRLRPRPQDYFVIKPQFSGFYATNLPVLLPRLKATRLVLAGVAADICVLFTAADAHMRAYDLWTPRDAVASDNPQHTDWALEIMHMSMGAEVRSTRELSLQEWVSAGGGA